VGSLNGGFLVERAGRQGDPLNYKKLGVELEKFWLEKVISFNMIAEKRSLLKVIFQIAMKTLLQ